VFTVPTGWPFRIAIGSGPDYWVGGVVVMAVGRPIALVVQGIACALVVQGFAATGADATPVLGIGPYRTWRGDDPLTGPLASLGSTVGVVLAIALVADPARSGTSVVAFLVPCAGDAGPGRVPAVGGLPRTATQRRPGGDPSAPRRRY
jgi:hypothetical protein